MLKFKTLTQEFQEIYEKMEKTVLVLEKDLRGLRTGRVSTSLIDSVKVDVHGHLMELYQISNISVVNNQTLSVRLWDKNIIKKAEKALLDSNLGINTTSEDDLISVKVPLLSEDRRKELVKIAFKHAEKVKVMLRSIRKDYNDQLKLQEKNKEISKDDFFKKSKTLQNILDFFMEKIDQKVDAKTNDIMTV